MASNYLARNLQYLRKIKGINQSEIEAQLNIKRNTWSNYENAVSEPNLNKLIFIAHYFDVDLSDLTQKNLSDGGDYEKSEGQKKGIKGGFYSGNDGGDYQKGGQKKGKNLASNINCQNCATKDIIIAEKVNTIAVLTDLVSSLKEQIILLQEAKAKEPLKSKVHQDS